MKTLRETIRNLMMENASLVSTSVVDEIRERQLIFVVDAIPPYNFDIYLCSESDYDQEYGDINDFVGKINIGNIGKKTMQVSLSDLSNRLQRKGIGALMYNVALASCTKAGLWLMSDRAQVSGKADRIWDTWKNMPDIYDIDQTDHEQPDESYSATQFDDYDPEVDYFLTKTRGDDFIQGSFQDNDANFASYSDDDPRAQWGDMVKDWWYFFDDDYKEDFLKSGLTKRFKMKDADSFTETLEELELLYYI